jgi:hypothetical protein
MMRSGIMPEFGKGHVGRFESDALSKRDISLIHRWTVIQQEL